jgi:hypothetical protein
MTCSVTDGSESCDESVYAKGLCIAHYFRLYRTGSTGLVEIRNTTNLRPCGTLAAFRRHQRRGEEPCEACRKASRASGNARQKALNRLAREYPQRFRELLRDEQDAM